MHGALCVTDWLRNLIPPALKCQQGMMQEPTDLGEVEGRFQVGRQDKSVILQGQASRRHPSVGAHIVHCT